MGKVIKKQQFIEDIESGRLKMPWHINIGSGQRPFARPFINCDVQSKWNPDICCDANTLPFEENSASIVVLHHVLEHFGLGEADSLIRECHRVLQPGGSLLVFVPHLEALMDAYRLRKIDEYTLLVNLYGAYMGDEADRHKWGFANPISLQTALRKPVEWYTVSGFNWRDIPGASIARDFWITGVEAIK